MTESLFYTDTSMHAKSELHGPATEYCMAVLEQMEAFLVSDWDLHLAHCSLASLFHPAGAVDTDMLRDHFHLRCECELRIDTDVHDSGETSG